MPLMFAAVCEKNIIRKVGGMPDAKKRLEDLGFDNDLGSAVNSLGAYTVIKIERSCDK